MKLPESPEVDDLGDSSKPFFGSMPSFRGTALRSSGRPYFLLSNSLSSAGHPVFSPPDAAFKLLLYLRNDASDQDIVWKYIS